MLLSQALFFISLWGVVFHAVVGSHFFRADWAGWGCYHAMACPPLGVVHGVKPLNCKELLGYDFITLVHPNLEYPNRLRQNNG